MLPEFKEYIINGKRELCGNPTAVIELARSTDTPAARKFLKAYHAVEAKIAAEKPFLAEDRIRGEAAMEALRRIGLTIQNVKPDPTLP